jgi:O-antigen/teichoic acid export membrane protein
MVTPIETGSMEQSILAGETLESRQPTRLTPSSQIARNATLNLLSEGWIFLVLVVAMPKLVQFLGDASFGLFSLAWVIIGYLTVLDIGVSRAATKFVSEHLVEQDLAATRQVIRTAITANLVLGLAGGFAIALVSPFLVRSVFKVGDGLENQANVAFLGAALAVPVLLVQGIFRAVLCSFQRFGWITSINSIATTMQWGVACFLARRGYGVGMVVLSTVLVRMLATAGYVAVLRVTLPDLHLYRAPDLVGLSKLMRFGSWVTVSQLVGPLLVYVDRFFVASFVSLSAVALYTVPYEVMSRLRIIPSSLVASLYPAFSERGSEWQETQLQHLYEGSVRYLLLLLAPITLFLAVLGPDLLAIWMGAAFAQKTGSVLQILALGALANGIAYVPYNMLQALGRPDLTAKIHLVELPFYAIVCILLIPRWGIDGAAAASTFRFALDSVLLFWAARKCSRCSLRNLKGSTHLRILAMCVALSIALLAIRQAVVPDWSRLILGCLAVAITLFAAWIFAVPPDEKRRLSLMRVVFRQTTS